MGSRTEPEYVFGDLLNNKGELTLIMETDPDIKFHGGRNRRIRKGIFLCSCGKLTNVSLTAVKSGSTKSCGCKRRARGGAADSPTYWSWSSMIKRCETPQQNRRYYIDRGISVCSEWRGKEEGFNNFLQDMGKRPDGCTLDRKDPAKGYYKENCRWVDKTEQSYNQRLQANNTSGCTGVQKHGTRWQVSISKNNKTLYYGGYEKYKDAVNVRILAEMENYGYSITLRDMGINQSQVNFEELNKSLSRRSNLDPLENLKRESILTEDQKEYVRTKYKPYLDKKAPNGFKKKLAEELGVGEWVLTRIIKDFKDKEVK